MIYPDLLDESESVLHHLLLPLQLHGNSGLRLRLLPWRKRLLRDGWRLVERLRQRHGSGVLTGQPAHLTER